MPKRPTRKNRKYKRGSRQNGKGMKFRKKIEGKITEDRVVKKQKKQSKYPPATPPTKTETLLLAQCHRCFSLYSQATAKLKYRVESIALEMQS